ncbi:MAG: hypothetical protein LBI04_04920 [Treponema sp.]|jgi:hypothetical protein|nr:hypothetical protein [Treponema sp.]
MKTIVTSALKLFLAAIIYTVLFVLVSALVPFSQGFKELGSSEHPTALLFMFINGAWVCFTIYFIIKHSNYSGIKLFINVLFVMFFINFFMTQIETWFFGHAFALTKPDIILIMLSGLFPLLGTTALLIKFFQNKNAVYEKEKINIKSILIKLGIIGIIYLCVYLLFGYFVLWQFEEARLFYSGSTANLKLGESMGNTNIGIGTNSIFIPLQILRGILFGIFILPLKNMMSTKNTFIASVCLVYLCTAVQLIIPNVLFPDMVRIAHLIEMSSSMLLFGMIAGNTMWGKSKKSCT